MLTRIHLFTCHRGRYLHPIDRTLILPVDPTVASGMDTGNDYHFPTVGNGPLGQPSVCECKERNKEQTSKQSQVDDSRMYPNQFDNVRTL